MSTARQLGLLSVTLTWSLAAIWLLRPARPAPSVPVPIHHNTALELAATVLREADRFYAAQTGYGGFNPPEVLAWRYILPSDRADSVFKAILHDGPRPGQLYALAGLYLIDSVAYKRESRRLRSLAGDVPTVIGCIVGARSVSSVLDDMDRGWWTKEFLAARLIHH